MRPSLLHPPTGGNRDPRRRYKQAYAHRPRGMVFVDMALIACAEGRRCSWLAVHGRAHQALERLCRHETRANVCHPRIVRENTVRAGVNDQRRRLRKKPRGARFAGVDGRCELEREAIEACAIRPFDVTLCAGSAKTVGRRPSTPRVDVLWGKRWNR